MLRSNFQGHPNNLCMCVCVCKFLKILMVLDKTIHNTLEFIKLHKQSPLENCFIFTISKLYFGFKIYNFCCCTTEHVFHLLHLHEKK